MPKDRKKERRGKDKPYVKGTQNEAATRDSDDEPETCCVCEEVIKESIIIILLYFVIVRLICMSTVQ